MKKLCGECVYLKELEGDDLDLRPFDGHCMLSMGLVFADDECGVEKV